ncbi:MAG: hypothetical protein ACK5O3_06235 [Burkholderiales bacterium]|jgi:hypothetical protein
MGLVRALLVFLAFWAVFALLIQGVLHFSQRQRWRSLRLLGFSALAAALAAGVLWVVVILF